MTVQCSADGLTWPEVSRSNPCQICKKPDWCCLCSDGSVAMCMRISEGCFRAKDTNAGRAYFHRLKDSPEFQRRSLKAVVRSPKRRSGNLPERRKGQTRDWSTLAAECAAAITAAELDWLQLELGVAPHALRRLGVGTHRGLFVFPEKNHRGEVMGLSTRDHNGRKKFVYGGHHGLFIPNDLDLTQTVVLPEGASDTAACLTLGIEAVGRPSNTGGINYLAELLRNVDDVLVLGENDRTGDEPEGVDPPGIKGAKYTAKRLAELWGRPVRWALPPGVAKDLRSWLCEMDCRETEELRGALL